MSLTVDGVWKAGVWATTVWGEGVWFEGQQDDLRGRRRRGRKKLYVVKFDDAQIGVDSAEEMIALARLSDHIPKVTLHKRVDYGPILDDLKAGIRLLEKEMRDRDDDEVIALLLH